MAKFTRNFTLGKMNKMVDERLVPNGEYIDALNVRMGSTEAAEIGVIENSKGNEQLTTIVYNGTPLSSQAKCIGAFEDRVNETIYWFIHDEGFTQSPTGKLDLIVSYDTKTGIIQYHIESINDGFNINTTLNFDKEFLITGVNRVEDLLFFTDNLNAPRRINVTKNYDDPVNNVDGFLAEDILVIKRPPVDSPTVNLVQTGGQETFLEERFICFAYRYKYEDDEYSATSQFSNPAFIPNEFNFTQESYLNEGMTNFYNTAEITFNTGGPLVKGIDLLFKDANSPVVKIIEKLTKADNGYVDYQDVTYQFKNSKIFTILPEADILRMYDNVPRYAQAQTIMGNRLMYGNYVEGYDMVDKDDNPVRLDFTVSQENIGFDPEDKDGTLSAFNYTIGGVTQQATQAKATLDFTDIDLVEGALIAFTFNFQHYTWNGTTPTPSSSTINEGPIIVTFAFLLTIDYASVYEWVTSAEFQALIGTSLPNGTIQPMATADNGTTMTDVYNQQFIGSLVLDGVNCTKFASGITAPGEAISVTANTSNNLIQFVFPAVQYKDTAGTSGRLNAEYFNMTSSEFTYAKSGNGSSLHSNRGYEIGMIYMDDFNRATTALVSQYNTEHIDCSQSATRNILNVNIPKEQIAPKWATRYKFAIKPDKETYDTIFTNIFFTDPDTNDTYFLLEGENSAKITDGQRLIVKADSSGPTTNCIYATVLEKKAYNGDEFDPVDSEGNELSFLSGTYMKIKARNFSVESSANAVIDTGTAKQTAKKRDTFPQIALKVYLGGDGSGPNPYFPYDIPGGSRVEFDFKMYREGTRDGDGKCELREYELNKTVTVSQDYDSFYDFWLGDNLQNVITQGIATVGAGGGNIENEFITAVPSGAPSNGSLGTNFWQFGNLRTMEDGSQKPLYLYVSGTRACEQAKHFKNRRSSIEGRIIVYRAESTLIFESEPLDASPDIWYEGEDSFGIVRGDNFCQYDVAVLSGEPFPIVIDYQDTSGLPRQISIAPDSNSVFVAACGTASINTSTPPTSSANVTGLNSSIPIVDGTHLGNIQNQDLNPATSQPAISNTDFFNCYAFGNGCESYKVRDSLLGKDFKLGNRVTSTAALDYKEVRRFADITYSGIYNDESNVNRLNEFNSGLLNFKPLEESFGPIQKLFARETDVLTFQEDKISYVLSGKNLLSDAGTGSLLQSVPEVLGTQIARIEEFGISFNPESFAQWGADKYFTDAKRGSVLRLVGTSYSNEQLEVVSSYGMRTWFRDLFLVDFEKQKLGGFDPYMNEYVLAANQQGIPIPKTCVACGIQQEITITPDQPFDNCFELGDTVGDVEVAWSLQAIKGSFNITIEYDGITQQANNQTQDGSITFNKSKISITECNVTITPSQGQTDVTLILTVPCPDAKSITIVEVCATTPNEQGLLVHNEHRFVDGTYVSPLQSTQVQFGQGSTQPIVSFYSSILGSTGSGPIPTPGSNVTLAFNKFAGDTAVFEPSSNKFRWLATTQNYANTQASVGSLLAASIPMSTNSAGAPNYYTGTFTMPPVQDGEYLYIIYDYRKPTLIDLCYDNKELADACCDCDLID